MKLLNILNLNEHAHVVYHIASRLYAMNQNATEEDTQAIIEEVTDMGYYLTAAQYRAISDLVIAHDEIVSSGLAKFAE